MSQIEKSTFNFLRDLEKNNQRDWFAANKDRYESAHANVLSFTEELLAEMKKQDLIANDSAKKTLFRIYRDVRFSKDKSPYKSYFSGSLKRATKKLRGGYYFHIQPGGRSMIAGGFWNPDSKDILHIRKHIQQDPKAFQRATSNKKLLAYFGELKGDAVKTAPKGFSKEDPAIEFLRYKQFLYSCSFTDKEALSKDFHKEFVKGFKSLKPFFDYMSEILTTDLNGSDLPGLEN